MSCDVTDNFTNTAYPHNHAALHTVLGVLHRVLGVLHRILGVPHRILGIPHRVLRVPDRVLGLSQKASTQLGTPTPLPLHV